MFLRARDGSRVREEARHACRLPYMFKIGNKLQSFRYRAPALWLRPLATSTTRTWTPDLRMHLRPANHKCLPWPSQCTRMYVPMPTDREARLDQSDQTSPRYLSVASTPDGTQHLRCLTSTPVLALGDNHGSRTSCNTTLTSNYPVPREDLQSVAAAVQA